MKREEVEMAESFLCLMADLDEGAAAVWVYPAYHDPDR